MTHHFTRPEEDIRLDCLKLAVQAHERFGPSGTVETARVYLAFVSGASDMTASQRSAIAERGAA